ncbi:hypothetical protein ACTA71_006030 [Dictyostelium dimigraforme]
MKKVLFILIIIFTLFSCSHARRKALAQFYPPVRLPHPQTGSVFRCSYVGANGPRFSCGDPGVYIVFSINPVLALGQNRQFPLRYIGRSVDNVLRRINDNRDDGKYIAGDVVCYMRFPRDPVWNNNNDVTTIEQTLLSAFGAPGNGWEQNGFAEWRGDVYFTDPTNLGYDIMRSFYTMDLSLPITNMMYVNGNFWDNFIDNHIMHMQVQKYNLDIDTLFSEGIPYEGGYVIDGEDDYCSLNETKFKKHSVDYLESIGKKMAMLINQLGNQEEVAQENEAPHSATAATVADKKDGHHGLAEAAKIGGAAVGGAAAVAGGYAGYQAVAEASFGRQLGNWARSISKEAWERGFGAWKEGAGKGANYARQGARQGYEAWKEGAEEGVNYARQGARQGYDAWKEGADEGVNYARQGARQGYEAWKDGAEEGVNYARQGAQRVGNAIRPPPQGGTNVVLSHVQEI